MDIDPRQIAKADIIRQYIKDLWSQNQICMSALEEHIINNPADRQTISSTLRPSEYHTQYSTHPTNTPLEVHLTHSSPEDSPIQEIIMTEKHESQNELQEEIQEVIMTDIEGKQEGSQDLEEITELPKDIRNVSDYKIRNRTIQPANSFFITKKRTFTAGVLMANTPGENKEEQINYLIHILKLVKKEKSLVNTDFINGNS